MKRQEKGKAKAPPPKKGRTKEPKTKTKTDIIKDTLGNSSLVTRKIKLSSILRPEYAETMEQKIIQSSGQIRHILLRAQLFLNYYVIRKANEALDGNNIDLIDSNFFKQKMFYKLCSLVMGKTPKDLDSLPANMMNDWRQLVEEHPEAIYTEPLLPGASQCLTAACVETMTVYNNMITLILPQRIKSYFVYKIKTILPEVCYYYSVCAVNNTDKRYF